MNLTLALSAAELANPAPDVFTIDQLAISPLNVRFDEVAIEKVDTLRQQIVAEGLLQGLTLHPAPAGAEWAGTAAFGVLAGGRRFRAIKRAIEAGELPSDFPITATVRDLPDGEIVLLSLIENIGREQLQLFETCRAVARAAAEGFTVDQIASKTGQRRRWVEQHLRLGDLAPEVFAAFIAGTITTDQAMAYAATEDRELQAAAWQALGRTAPAHAIRAHFKVGDRELTRQLQFVGEAVYRANGGKFELDLFADGPDAMRGRVTDEPLLARLVGEKLEVARGMARAAWGEADLRFQAAPPPMPGAYSYGADSTLEVKPRKRDWESARIPRGADPTDFVGTIEIEQSGEWTARLWWGSRKAKAAFEKRNEAPRVAQSSDIAPAAAFDRYSGAAQEAGRVAREEHGLTADGVKVVRSIRRDILRALLLTADQALAGDVPRDYLTWSSLRQELSNDRDTSTGARGLRGEGYPDADREPTDLLIDQRAGQEATALWGDAIQLLSAHPAFAGNDAGDALRAYLAEAPGFKRLAEAALAGIALVRSCSAPGWDISAQHVLADAVGGTPEHVRRFWQPTPAFTGLFGKLPRLGMAQPFVDEGERRQLAKARDRDLSARTAEILGEQHAWVHPLLAFDPPRQGEEGHPEDGGEAQAESAAREAEPAQ